MFGLKSVDERKDPIDSQSEVVNPRHIHQFKIFDEANTKYS